MILFNIFLILHIAGVAIIAGTTLTAFVISKQLWVFVETDRQKAQIFNSNGALFGKMTGIGGMLTILSGIAMVVTMHGAFVSQIWFQIKMILVLLIILNASFFARAQNKKLGKLLAAGNTTYQFSTIKSKMNLYYAIQCIFLMTIFVLSVFRFT
jgi:hypothetical protein